MKAAVATITGTSANDRYALACELSIVALERRAKFKNISGSTRNEPPTTTAAAQRLSNELVGNSRNGTGTGICERLDAVIFVDCRMIRRP
jgi:hypothetical protein